MDLVRFHIDSGRVPLAVSGRMVQSTVLRSGIRPTDIFIAGGVVFQVTHILSEELSDALRHFAAEGFPSAGEMREHLEEAYGVADPEEHVNVVRFKRVGRVFEEAWQ